MPSSRVSVLLLWALVGVAPVGWGKVVQNEDGTGEISFMTPTLNDEEYHSLHMPTNLMCDACLAIAYQLTMKFELAHLRRKSVKKFPESDIYPMIEEVCTDKNFEHYGVKEVEKVTRLSGPGLDTEEVAGIMQGGGKWPNRLGRMCFKYVEELDEDVIYSSYLEDNRGLDTLMCRNATKAGLTDACKNRPKKPRRGKKAKRDEL